MPHERKITSIFLLSVLIMGIASFPTDYNVDELNFENLLQNNYFQMIGFAFADDDDDEEDDEDEDDKEGKDKNEKAVKTSGRDDDGDEDDGDKDEIEIEVEIEDGEAKVDIEMGEDEFQFSLDTDAENKILEKIIDLTGLDESEIRAIWDIEIEDFDDEFDDDFDDDNGKRKITICHIPLGNPENSHQITISENALKAHLAHGDKLDLDDCGEPGAQDDFSIHGVKYEDIDNNGERNDEPGIEGWKIVLLLSSNTVDMTTTDATGTYWFDDLSEGIYEIREVQEFGWTQTQPSSETYEIILSSDSKTRGGFDFGNFFDTTMVTSKLKQEMTQKQSAALQDAEDTIQKLMQRIEQLEQRLQALLEMLESGEYFGNLLDGDQITKSYNLSFEGSTGDDFTASDIKGEIYLENLVTRDDASKFRVIGGEITLDNLDYDIIFGKARVSSQGPSGEKDSMVLVAQIVDDDGISRTLKLVLGFDSALEGDFGQELVKFEVKAPQSGISDDLTISAKGSFIEL